jgi:4-amino-4-deoxy-L-arabinose transferase-like glycosyltransferase
MNSQKSSMIKLPIGVMVFLSLLVGSSFLIKWHNFRQTRVRTIDENVFYSVAKQLTTHPFVYNAQTYVQKTQKDISRLPEYLSAPLFKHPPLFSYTLSLSLQMLGDHEFAVALIPLLCGSLLIPLVYLLARLVEDDKIALLSAILVYMDPFTIMCSQKVWLDSMLALFTTASFYFYLKGFHLQKVKYFVRGGIIAGLAVLTKYPGILVILVISTYALLYDRKLFRNIHFLISLLIPFMLLIPWAWWNIEVYGIAFYLEHFKSHGLSMLHWNRLHILTFLSLFISLTLIFWKKIVPQHSSTYPTAYLMAKKLGAFLFLLFLFLLVAGSIIKNLNFYDVPQTAWKPGLLKHDGPLLYVKRLVEFSLIYLFSFLSFLMIPDEREKPLLRPIQTAVFIYMTFYILYGNYQMRYILMAIPLLIVLAASCWMRSFKEREKIASQPLKNFAGIFLWGILIISLIKTLIINIRISFPNDMCYF